MTIPLMDKQVMHMYKHMHFNTKENICMREKRILKLCKNIKSEHSLKSKKSENISETDITEEINHF